MYDGMVDTSGLIMWSRKDETRSVGPLQPLTTDPMWGFVEFFEKVHALGSYLV